MVFVLVFLVSLLLTWLVRGYAVRKSILDIPNDRSSHVIPTPRGGGLAVAITWFAGLIFLFLYKQIEPPVFYALLAGLPLALIGFFDDMLNLKPGIRFQVQFLSAALALFFLGGLKFVNFGSWLIDDTLLLSVAAFIAIIWSVNLFNFLDGIDGYIGSEVVFIGLAAFALTGDGLGLLLAFATLGFLFWNWPKAKIFMGDVGSTLLGFSVAVLALYHQNHHISSLWVWLILTSVFWFDATVTIIHRFINKEKLSEAHRKHAYQRLVQSGFSHQRTTLSAVFLNVLGFGLAWLAHGNENIAWLFLVADLSILVIALRYVDKRKPFEYRSGIRKL